MDDEPDPDDDAAARADRAAGADAIDLVKLAEKVHEFEIHPGQQTVWWLLTR